MKNRIKVFGAIAVLALGLGGCLSNQQLQDDITVGIQTIRGVSCVIGGAGGDFTQKVEQRVRANQAWVGTTGDVVTISAAVCQLVGGTPAGAATVTLPAR